jgi:tRNA threonylcarbamoyladenosine biosynthesis protein TsaE
VATSIVERRLVARSPADLEDLAARVAAGLAAGDRIALSGELGAGKTVFVRGLAAGLGCPEPRDVVSPTFAIHNRYAGGRLLLDHLDLYRLSAPVSLAREGLDLVERDERTVLAVEWAERLDCPLPGLVLEIFLDWRGEDARAVTLRAPVDAASRLLGGVPDSGD